jgi:hypothetical protein
MDAAGANQPRDPACRANNFVSAGGTFPRNPHTLAIRWGGFANYELVYNGKIILLDAYYDRGSYYQPVGVKAADIKRVTFFGSRHSDHMSTRPRSTQIGAMVVGAPVTTEKLATQSFLHVDRRHRQGGEVLTEAFSSS